jgi:hypothetical protein
MSVFYICGKPGGGKTYIGVKQICDELKDPHSNRFIVTNIELRLPELAEWCHEHCQHEVNLAERIRVLDEAETGEFWLYEPHRKFDRRKDIVMARRTMSVPDFEDRASRGTLYVIDEVHIPFGARDWQATGTDATYFLSQHRKLQCDVILITQHPEQCDKALRRLAQEYMSVRNLDREPFLGFNLGSLFGAFRYTRTLNSPQSPNPYPFESGFVTLNVEEYGKLYDTMAGVGIAGRVAAPKHIKRGRHVAWLLVPVIAITCLAAYGWRHVSEINSFLSHSLEHMFFHGAGAVATAVHLPTAPPMPIAQNIGPFQRMFSAPSAAVASSPPVTNASAADRAEETYCSGFFISGSNSMVFLSDGRIAYAAYGDVLSIRPEKVKVFGEWYPVFTASQIEKIHPQSDDTYQPSAMEAIPSHYSPSDFASSYAALPPDHWQGSKPQVRNNFMVPLPRPILGMPNISQSALESSQSTAEQ